MKVAFRGLERKQGRGCHFQQEAIRMVFEVKRWLRNTSASLSEYGRFILDVFRRRDEETDAA